MKPSSYAQTLAAVLLASFAPSAMAAPTNLIAPALANFTAAAPPSTQQAQDQLKPEMYYCTDKNFGSQCKRDTYTLDTCMNFDPELAGKISSVWNLGFAPPAPTNACVFFTKVNCDGQWDYDGEHQSVWDLSTIGRDNQHMSYVCSKVDE